MSDVKQTSVRNLKSKNGRSETLISETTPDGTQHRLSNGAEVRNVVGFEDRFMVSDRGDLISKKTNKILSQTPDENGYSTHATKIGGRQGKAVLLRMHRVVAEAFIPNPDNKPEVNHDNGIKTDNVKDNLEWSTRQENVQHAHDTGLAVAVKGFKHGRAKLTPEIVKDINDLKGKVSSRSAAGNFNVDHTTVLRVWNGEMS